MLLNIVVKHLESNLFVIIVGSKQVIMRIKV